jgi:hypothetical protein
MYKFYKAMQSRNNTNLNSILNNKKLQMNDKCQVACLIKVVLVQQSGICGLSKNLKNLFFSFLQQFKALGKPSIIN